MRKQVLRIEWPPENENEMGRGRPRLNVMRNLRQLRQDSKNGNYKNTGDRRDCKAMIANVRSGYGT